jgi:hypothetical protein
MANYYRYFRTRGGAVIHLSTCRYAVPGPHAGPWKWAEGMDPIDVLKRVLLLGYKRCRVCKPFGGAS